MNDQAEGEAVTIRPRPCDQDVLMAAVALAFFAGILTVAAPCSLPVLPALLGVSLGQRDKAQPVLITMGFVGGFFQRHHSNRRHRPDGVAHRGRRPIGCVRRAHAMAVPLRMVLDADRRMRF
jgi:hypothetical protein